MNSNFINVGDRVRVEFWPMKNDLCGEVLSIAGSPGDCWVIRNEDRLFYVQHFATISKIVEGTRIGNQAVVHNQNEEGNNE